MTEVPVVPVLSVPSSVQSFKAAVEQPIPGAPLNLTL